MDELKNCCASLFTEFDCEFGNAGRNVLCNGAVSTAMDLQRRIVEALRLGKRGEASNLLLRLSQGNDLRGADDFVHVLNYCAARPDPLVS